MNQNEYIKKAAEMKANVQKKDAVSLCQYSCDPFFIKTDMHGYCKKCNKYLGYVRK